MREWINQKLGPTRQDTDTLSAGQIAYLTCAVAMLAWLGIGSSQGLVWQFLFFVVFVAGVGLYRLWLLPIALILLQIDLFQTELPIWENEQATIGQQIYAGAALLLVVASCRYVVVSGSIVSFYRRSAVSQFFAALKRVVPLWTPHGPSGIAPRAPGTFSSTELITGLLRVVLSVAVAATVLSVFAMDPYSASSTGLLPTANRAIRVGVGVLIVGASLYYVIEAIAWQLMSRREANMFLRGIVTTEHHADLQRIVRRQVKADRSRQTSE